MIWAVRFFLLAVLVDMGYNASQSQDVMLDYERILGAQASYPRVAGQINRVASVSVLMDVVFVSSSVLAEMRGCGGSNL